MNCDFEEGFEAGSDAGRDSAGGRAAVSPEVLRRGLYGGLYGGLYRRLCRRLRRGFVPMEVGDFFFFLPGIFRRRLWYFFCCFCHTREVCGEEI